MTPSVEARDPELRVFSIDLTDFSLFWPKVDEFLTKNGFKHNQMKKDDKELCKKTPRTMIFPGFWHEYIITVTPIWNAPGATYTGMQLPIYIVE